MNKIIKIYKFYSSALLLILLVNLVLFFSFGTYFEEYEGILSTFVNGTYTDYAIKEWNVDTHFLLFWFYSFLNQYVPDVQVYGVVLFTLNCFGLAFFGLVLFRILNINFKNDSIILFIFLYCLVAIDYSVNLGSTRIAFIIAVSVFAFIQSYFFEKKLLRLYHWIFFLIIFLFISLMRVEIVLLTTLSYLVILLFHCRLNKHVLFFLFIVSAVYISYNVVANCFLNEARQVYYFKEFDFIDRDNINYKDLTKLQLMDVEAFKQYLISDKEHFSLLFYDSIELNKSRFNLDSILSTFSNSIKAFKISWMYLLMAFISCFILWLSDYRNKITRFFYIGFCLFFPLILCLYLTIPQRFLVFYYSVISVLNFVLVAREIRYQKPVLFVCGLFIILFANSEIEISKRYKTVDERVQLASLKLKSLGERIGINTPIVINTTEYMGRYFPVKPLGKLEPQNAIFLSFWYFGSYNCYTDKWERLCNCNPLSLKEKIDYVITSKSVFITDEKTFLFLKDYLNLKYNRQLVKTDIDIFDGELKLCRLSYNN